MNRVIIIGGGPAGMLAALSAAKAGHSVRIFEKNEKLGKKLFITGKGRCNVTNDCDAETMFSNLVSNPKFFYSSYYGFTNQTMMELLEEESCYLKVERGGRVFPKSDHASDVIKALELALQREGVRIDLNTRVKSLVMDRIEEDGVSEKKVIGIITEQGEQINATKVIIATGGLSYPLTGSDGDGFTMAKAVGHKVTDLSPALVPMNIKEDWCKKLQGLALKNITATVLVKNKKVYEGFGEMLFTHFGVSGPLILSASSFFSKKESSDENILRIDLKPALTMEQLDKRLLREFEANHKKNFKNILQGLFPSSLIPIMISLSGIAPEQKVNEISKEKRQYFAHLIKNWDMTITGLRGYAEAIITQGGICVKEVNPATMESKLIKGLYFAGEILDLDALTGGFNLQIAWSTGFAAGNNIEE